MFLFVFNEVEKSGRFAASRGKEYRTPNTRGDSHWVTPSRLSVSPAGSEGLNGLKGVLHETPVCNWHEAGAGRKVKVTHQES